MKRFKIHLKSADVLGGSKSPSQLQLKRIQERFDNENRVYDGLGYLENGQVIVFQHTDTTLNMFVLRRENYEQISFEITEYMESCENDSWYWSGLHENMLNRWRIMLPSKVVQYGFMEEERSWPHRI